MTETAPHDLRVAVLGLGEAGAAIAADLVARGVDVRGFDPDPERRVSGVRRAARAAEAVEGTDVVLSLNSAAAAVAVAKESVGAMSPGGLYADLNTTSPATKRELGAIADLFVDVALLAPVPGRGIRTPALASGPGAAAFAARFEPLGMRIEQVGPHPGEAATRKLVRSVFMKGLAAAAAESLAAGEAAGCGEWLRGEIVAVLEGADEALLDRLLTGSRAHAVRRVDEMEAATELLRELGVEPRIAAATAASLADLAQAVAS